MEQNIPKKVIETTFHRDAIRDCVEKMGLEHFIRYEQRKLEESIRMVLSSDREVNEVSHLFGAGEVNG